MEFTAAEASQAGGATEVGDARARRHCALGRPIDAALAPPRDRAARA